MSTQPVISIRQLSATYPDGRRALRDVALEVLEGQSAAVLGPNGAGKSTLLMCLAGIIEAQGEIDIAGFRLSPRSLPDIRRKVQIVFQDPHDQLFMPVLLDDVAFGPANFGSSRDEARKRAMRSLEAVGLAGFQERNPFNMSHGERRRAAIATVLACDPDVILLDEPSAGLDPRGKRELAEILNTLPSTKLIATHDVTFARDTCRMGIVLQEGAVIATGSIDAILADSALLDSCGLR